MTADKTQRARPWISCSILPHRRAILPKPLQVLAHPCTLPVTAAARSRSCRLHSAGRAECDPGGRRACHTLLEPHVLCPEAGAWGRGARDGRASALMHHRLERMILRLELLEMVCTVRRLPCGARGKFRVQGSVQAGSGFGVEAGSGFSV